MSGIDRRGEVVALLGGLVSLAAAVVLGILAIRSESTAVWAASFQSLGTAGIWLLSLIQLHQARMVAQERLEIAALDRDRREKLGGARTIFAEEDLDQMEKLAMGRRLRSIERYLVPTVALTLAAYHIVAGAAIFPWRWQFPPISAAAGQSVLQAPMLLFFAGGIAFVCFMLSRYALGLSRLPAWSLLRAGGNYTFGTSATCLAVCVALLFAISNQHWVEVWLGRALGVLLIFMAGETIINFILTFYRPRVPGSEQRAFYDSRLLGMFSEPEGILRSMANAIDYQFGFKVSETWFYKLLGRAVLPLVGVQIVVILALTCIVVVPPGQQAVIEHWGKLRPHTAQAGVHLKWPWPVDRATVIPVSRIQRMEIGYQSGGEQDESSSGPILWTKRHYKTEHKLLVSDRAASATAKVPINLLSLNMPVQWCVKDDEQEVIRFYAQSTDVARIIEAIAYRELTHYAAQADVLDLLGQGGIRAAQELQRRIQSACDRAGYDGKGLGARIVLVGIGGVHPPPDDDVAKSYEDVVSAFETRDATIKGAQGDAAKIRLESAGIDWQELYDAIVLEDLARAADSPELAERTADVERILREVIGGRARVRTAEAVGSALARVFDQQSAAERYAVQLEAYRSSPEVYLVRAYLAMLEEGLRKVQKYVIALRDPSQVVCEVDTRAEQAIDILGAELSAMERKAK